MTHASASARSYVAWPARGKLSARTASTASAAVTACPHPAAASGWTTRFHRDSCPMRARLRLPLTWRPPPRRRSRRARCKCRRHPPPLSVATTSTINITACRAWARSRCLWPSRPRLAAATAVRRMIWAATHPAWRTTTRTRRRSAAMPHRQQQQQQQQPPRCFTQRARGAHWRIMLPPPPPRALVILLPRRQRWPPVVPAQPRHCPAAPPPSQPLRTHVGMRFKRSAMQAKPRILPLRATEAAPVAAL